jgi:hypothetical protein
MSTMCKLVFFLLNIIYRYFWGTLVIQITVLKGYVLQSTSPLQGRNGLLCNHNSFKNQRLLFPNRFSLHWGLRDSCIILNVSNCSERTSVCYLYTHWLIRILNFESRISDIESRISNDPSGLSHLSVVTTCSWNGVYSVMGSNHVIRSTFSLSIFYLLKCAKKDKTQIKQTYEVFPYIQ